MIGSALDRWSSSNQPPSLSIGPSWFFLSKASLFYWLRTNRTYYARGDLSKADNLFMNINNFGYNAILPDMKGSLGWYLPGTLLYKKVDNFVSVFLFAIRIQTGKDSWGEVSGAWHDPETKANLWQIKWDFKEISRDDKKACVDLSKRNKDELLSRSIKICILLTGSIAGGVIDR